MKAPSERVTVSKLIRELPARWMADEIELDPGERTRDR
jgi:hypothetical protein